MQVRGSRDGYCGTNNHRFGDRETASYRERTAVRDRYCIRCIENMDRTVHRCGSDEMDMIVHKLGDRIVTRGDIKDRADWNIKASVTGAQARPI